MWYNGGVGYSCLIPKGEKPLLTTEYSKGSSCSNKMYAIIYWVSDNELYPYLNKNKTLKLFESLSEADKTAEILNDQKGIDARVITIEGVKE